MKRVIIAAGVAATGAAITAGAIALLKPKGTSGRQQLGMKGTDAQPSRPIIAPRPGHAYDHLDVG